MGIVGLGTFTDKVNYLIAFAGNVIPDFLEFEFVRVIEY
jgi:hypothetical protein